MKPVALAVEGLEALQSFFRKNHKDASFKSSSEVLNIIIDDESLPSISFFPQVDQKNTVQSIDMSAEDKQPIQKITFYYKVIVMLKIENQELNIPGFSETSFEDAKRDALTNMLNISFE